MSYDPRTKSLDAFHTDDCPVCRYGIEVGQRITKMNGGWQHMYAKDCYPQDDPSFLALSYNEQATMPISVCDE